MRLTYKFSICYRSSNRVPFSEFCLENISLRRIAKKGHAFTQRRLCILGRHGHTIVPIFIIFVDLCDVCVVMKKCLARVSVYGTVM